MTQVPRFQRRAPDPDSLAADRLDGCGEITRFWFGHDTPENRKRIYRFAEMQTLPIGKLGSKLTASRRALTAAHRRITGMPSEAAE
jgi:hypothetical protein